MLPFIVHAFALANVCIKHTELKNSSNPVQTFVAYISDFGNLDLDPHVRYRRDSPNNLHVAQMTNDGCVNGNCTYSVSLGFDIPGRVSYSISSGDGFGHALWEPEHGLLGEFWILERQAGWIEITKPENVTSRQFLFNATFDSTIEDANFVFADSQKRVPFDSAVCVESRCTRTANIDVEKRNMVIYYIETLDKTRFWPDYQKFEMFRVIAPQINAGDDRKHLAKISDGAWAGIGIGIAIGVAGIVYAVVWATRKSRFRGSAEETQNLISGTSI